MVLFCLLFLLCVRVCVCVCVCVCVRAHTRMHVLNVHTTHTYTFLPICLVNPLYNPEKSKRFFLDIQGPGLTDVVVGFQFRLKAPDGCKT